MIGKGSRNEGSLSISLGFPDEDPDSYDYKKKQQSVYRVSISNPLFHSQHISIFHSSGFFLQFYIQRM